MFFLQFLISKIHYTRSHSFKLYLESRIIYILFESNNYSFILKYLVMLYSLELELICYRLPCFFNSSSTASLGDCVFDPNGNISIDCTCALTEAPGGKFIDSSPKFLKIVPPLFLSLCPEIPIWGLPPGLWSLSFLSSLPES